jgi:hypothetical protein
MDTYCARIKQFESAACSLSKTAGSFCEHDQMRGRGSPTEAVAWGTYQPELGVDPLYGHHGSDVVAKHGRVTEINPEQ